MMGATTTIVSPADGAAARRSPAMWPPAERETSEKLVFIEEMTTNVAAVQERVLAEILGRNGDSEYLVKYCGVAADRATFRAKVPMVTYEDLKPYIMRVANGDESPVLTGSAHPITEFFYSSGTSGGEPKLIPIVKDEPDRRQLLFSLLMPVMNQFVPAIGKGSRRRSLHFLFVRSEMKTTSGLPVRSGLTNRYKSDHFKNLVCHTYTSPLAAILCEDVFQSMYVQVVCGLCLRHDVVSVGATFAAGLLRAVQFLQQHWEQLAEDIKAGELGPRISDPSVREAAAGILRPDHELAQFILTECSNGDWAGIITRIWPNTTLLETIATGSMAQYVPTLKYLGGDLPIASTRYAASEYLFGINLRPLCDPSEVSYTILPNMAYFEFLPVDDGTDDATSTELVELAGVETGREYELVVTTYNGLNRYRVGDVLRVTGFHNAAPQFKFVGRKKVLLSIDADKTGEAELQRAVERASALLHPHGAAVLDYTSCACVKSIPGHYVIYWELRLATQGQGAKSLDGSLLDSCCLEMEEALGYIYRLHRVKDGTIGPLEIRVVRSDTFEELADYAVSRGTSIGQYKVPRSVTSPAIIQLLDSRIVSSHLSPGVPHWAPQELDKEKCSGSA